MCPLGLYCLINVGYVLFFLLAAKEDKRCALEEIDDDEEKRKQTVDIPWILDLSHGKLSEKRKDDDECSSDESTKKGPSKGVMVSFDHSKV